jgi:hypothetical protein
MDRLAKHAKEAELYFIESVLKKNQCRLVHIRKNLKNITKARNSKKIGRKQGNKK